MMTKNEILAAMNSPKFGSLPMKDKEDSIDGVLKYLYSLRGYTVADGVQPEIDAAVRVLEDRIAHRFQHLTVDEIRLALEMGVTGYWTKDKRLTIANYLDWLSKYNTSPERAEAVDERMNRHKSLTQSQAAALLPAEDIERKNEEAGRSAALKEFERFKQCGRLDICVQGYGAMIYDYLLKRGCLNPSDALIREAYKRSKNHMRGGVQPRQRRIGDVIADFNPERAEASQLLDWSTKCELLTMYYSTLQARGMSLQL